MTKKKATDSCNHCKNLDDLTANNSDLETENKKLQTTLTQEKDLHKTSEDLLSYKDKKISILEERLRDLNGLRDVW